MKVRPTLTIFLVIGLASMSMATTQDSRVEKSRAVVMDFMQTLKGALQEAMKSGGPVNAIKVCKVTAPEIARQQSEKHGWKVGRTSLKLRNPNNAPDAWERETLLLFEKRKLAGEDITKMEHAEEVTEDGTKRFRYMKAIPTIDICTKCHGKDLDPDAETQLRESYPEDKARGFEAGDIRGAFTITQPM